MKGPNRQQNDVLSAKKNKTRTKMEFLEPHSARIYKKSPSVISYQATVKQEYIVLLSMQYHKDLWSITNNQLSSRSRKYSAEL